jgi:polyphosphate kinase
MAFPPVGPSSLRYQAMTPLPHRDINPEISLFDTMRKKDLLLNYPYHSFHHFIDLLREASIDPNVEAIKITIYRAATNSKVINALINASRNGKAVTVVLELQARFDEEANIHWTTRLREEGVKIIHGVPDLKVHCKLCLISRRDREGLRRYACIGTGNFNESTARVYSDHSLFTSDSRLTGEVEKIFEFFKHNYKTSQFSHLLVSPFYLRKKLTKLVDNEIRNARKGKEASIFLKMNSLMDKDLIDKLYEASSAGVRIRMIVRGICSLVPGIEGMSENISIVSIVDRFLEHSRIFIFHNGGEELYYISSADWMTRNLDRRVEVVCPIYDRGIKKELTDFLDLQFRDNTKAREIDESQSNRYVEPKPDERKVRAQFDHYEYLKNKLIH